MSLFSFFEGLRALLEMHLLLAAGYLFFLAAWRLARPARSRAWVRLGQALIALCLLLPLAVRALPRSALLKPAAHLMAGGTRGGGAPYPMIALSDVSPRRESADRALALTESLLRNALLLLALGVAASLLRLGWRRRHLARFLRAQTPWKSIGRVRVLLADDVVPFSARHRGLAYVVLPAELLADPRWRLAFRHESIHHRRGDTRWVYFMETVRSALWGNPAVGAFARLLDRLQELACDETVLARRGLSAHAYGECLFEVARRARAAPVYSHGLAAPAAPSFLRERIERLFTLAEAAPSRAVSVAAPAALLALAAIALTLRSTIQDRRLTLSEARTLVADGRPGTIPLDVNDAVLARLNGFIGTPEGRARVKAGLRRLPKYQELFAAKFAAYGAPAELAAVALFESGLNRMAVSPGAGAAGIWQFMADTARRYGLTVGKERDDRLHPERSTDAAMRYLADLHQRFGDWRLALKAYNEGEQEVERLIRDQHTRDPWILDRVSSPENYLSGAVAMMIVLRHPYLLD